MRYPWSIVLKSALSLFIGISFALAFALPLLGDEAYTPLDRAALVVVPAAALTLVAYYFFSLDYVNNLSSFSWSLTLGLAFGAAVIWEIFSPLDAPFRSAINVISITVLFFAVILFPAPFLQKTLEGKDNVRLMVSWLFAGVISFFITGFLSNFYVETYQVALLAALSLFVSGAVAYHGIGRGMNLLRTNAAAFWLTASLFALLIIFQIIIFKMGAGFPKMFDAGSFLLEDAQVAVFFVAVILSLPWLACALHCLRESPLRRVLVENKFVEFIRKNLSGLLLSALFFYLYLLIGSILNQPRFDVDDIFFDSDGFIWRFRLTTENWQDFYWRSVHPLALLILRPAVSLLSMLLHGNAHFAAITLTALAGAACIFLAWLFMKRLLQNAAPALLVATLLGISTSHLIFGSLIETYIFLAVSILLFFVLVRKGKPSMSALIVLGTITMGITLTNFAQTLIAFFGSAPKVKSIFKYVLAVGALVVSFTLVSNLFYPKSSPYFFVPSGFLAEQQNVRTVSLNRARALVYAFLFNNIAAPEPLLSYKDIPFTQFRFYRAEDYRTSGYETPLQIMTASIWLVLLVVAAVFFVRDFKSQNISLTLSLLGCVLFNLLVHLRYGKELFLYSTNWTYAVVLLVGISWRRFLPRGWFQALLVAFLLLLMLNNVSLLRTIMEVSSL